MKRILITEDDRFMANVCREKLEEAGYEVVLAHDGHDAIEQLVLHPPDLVLLDLMLPEIDGLGVLRFLRSREALRALPVIVVSNSTYFSGVVQAAWQAGATHFLNKGDCSPRTLVDEVRKVLSPDVQPAAAPALPPSSDSGPDLVRDHMEPPPLPPMPPRQNPSEKKGVLRVLLADDDRVIHGVITYFMKQAGIDVRSAFNGREALEMAEADPPDILVLDTLMPELDGRAVLTEWMRRPALMGIPVIMLTGRNDETARAVALAGGAVEYLIKPFSPDDLVAKALQHSSR